MGSNRLETTLDGSGGVGGYDSEPGSGIGTRRPDARMP